MSYLDDLKKKGQNLVQNVQNAGNAAYNGAKTLYDTARNVGNNVYNAATGKSTNQQQNQQPQQTTMGQQETDWLAEYDSYKADEEAKKYSAGAQGAVGSQAANVTPAAQAALGEGAGQWKSELDGIMNKILNGEKFSYDMNGDAMYQQMADMHKNNANLAMQNAMAQAAAMTGGYGSSYGQMVGQQAFAGQMQGLNDIGMDLYNQALNEYIAEGDRLNNQYAMLAERESLDYNRGIDERNFEYQKGQDELAQKNYEGEFAYQKDRDAVSDSQWDKSFEYQQGRDDVADKQWSESMQYQKDRDAVADSQWDKSFGYQQERDQVADEQWRESMDYQASRDDIADAQWQAELDRYLANDETAKEQWQAEYDRATANDKLAAEQWDKAFAADEEQRGIDNAYRDATLAEEQRQFDTNLEYQQGRDVVEDEQWNKQFAETQEQNKADNAYRNAALEEDQRQFNAMYGYTDENGTYHEGYNDRAREDEQAYQQGIHNDLYGYTDENGTYHKGYYEEQADREFEQMYGDFERNEDGSLKLDENGDPIGGGFVTKQNAQDQKNWQAEYDREGDWYADAQEAANPNTTYEGEGALNGQSVPKQLAGVQGLTTTNPGLFDDNGYFKQAAVVKSNIEDGSMTYNIGGKNVSVQKGTSPYTNTRNPDAKNGTFDNGYQPDNIGGEKLEETEWEYPVNGQYVPTYIRKSDNTEWAYDAANNKYFPIPVEEKKEESPKDTATGSTIHGGSGAFGGSIHNKPPHLYN